MVQKEDVLLLRGFIRKKLTEALKDVGYTVEVGRAKYGDRITFALEIIPVKDDGEQQTKIGQDFARYCYRGGFHPYELGREFISRGVQYRIIGWNANNYKYDLACERCSDRKPFKFSSLSVRPLLAPFSERDIARHEARQKVPFAMRGNPDWMIHDWLLDHEFHTEALLFE